MKKIVSLFILTLSGCGRDEMPVYGSLPAFSLTESSGRPFTDKQLAGKVWIADFIFTRCAGTCPLMTERMQKLQQTLPAEVALVSFTVDPERDTPEVLSNYARRYGADPNRWVFLTGSKESLHQLSIEGFKLAVDETSGSEIEPITHSTRLVLVDQQGRIRGYYSGIEDEGLIRLSADARQLL